MTIEFKFNFSGNGNFFYSIVCVLIQNIFEILAGFRDGFSKGILEGI